jgi:hypothetical protein
MSGSQDVEAINFPAVCCRHRPNDASIFSQARVKILPFGRGDFFRIIQTRAGETGRQDHCRSGHWPGEWPSARLIHSRDLLQTAGVECGFEG